MRFIEPTLAVLNIAALVWVLWRERQMYTKIAAELARLCLVAREPAPAKTAQEERAHLGMAVLAELARRDREEVA